MQTQILPQATETTKKSEIRKFKIADGRRIENHFLAIIAHMANLSFAGCRFPAVFNTAQVLPLLKKPGLDKEQMSSYRPISNLVLDRLRPHLL